MAKFPPEIITGLTDNTLTKLSLSVAEGLQGLQFNNIQIPVPKKRLKKMEQDGKNRVYSSSPLFTDEEFSIITDALTLNTSLTNFEEKACSVFSEEQYSQISKIVKRNTKIKQKKMKLLHYAASVGDFQVVQACVWQAKELQDLEVKWNNKTPLEYAQGNNHLLIAEFLQCQIDPNKTKVQLINKPLSRENKLYIFNSLRLCSALKADFKEMLIAAALDGAEYPPQFKQKLAPLQAAYLANKDSQEVSAALRIAITLYFDEEGLSSFKKLLAKTFKESDWCSKLMQILAKDNIIIKENPYVLATIKNGKIYWCVVLGDNKTIYRKDHESVITQAKADNQTWQLTWEEFRKFKDGGKRTGTVCVTKDRFVENYKVSTKKSRGKIWELLCKVGILDKKFRLSPEWYPFSGTEIKFPGIDTYQQITDALERITANPKYAETIVLEDADEIIDPEMVIYREALISKTWASTGRVTNNDPKSDKLATKLWHVGSYRELRDHAVTQDPPCEIDHIPSKSQINTLCKNKMAQIDVNIKKLKKGSPKITQYQAEREELAKASTVEGKLSTWGIYIDKKLHKIGDTNGTPKEKQEELTVYSSIKEHIDNLKTMLASDELSIDMFLTALGAFRYLYSRLCKQIVHIDKQNIITNVPFQFFGLNTKAAEREEMDALFIEEMRSLQDTKFNTSGIA